jgi:autotransporter-associated beta strand protein
MRLEGTWKSLVVGALCAVVAVIVLSGEATAQSRVYGVDVSYWQGEIAPYHWTYANDPNNAAYDRVFSIVRSTRGGTTGLGQTSGTPGGGTQETLSRRYDDSRFLQNMTRAAAAGIITAPYHFARPDILTNTAADEADHFIQTAGVFMRPGYMLPMYDLEAGQGPRTAQELAEFSVAFSNRIYEVMKIRPSIYANGSYFDYLSGADTPTEDLLAKPSPNSPSMVSPAYPVVVGARYAAGSGNIYNEATYGSLQTQNPKDAGSTLTWYHGSFDNYGDANPWHIWQYGSGEAPFGPNTPDPNDINPDQNVDGDVAHGDMEYLRDMLVPAVWWNDASGDWSTMQNWNSGQPAPTPQPGAGQAAFFSYDPAYLPVARLPGAAGTGPSSGQYDTVILERESADITVTVSTGTHNIRKMYMRESLNITGGTLTINYDPTYRADTSIPNVTRTIRHGGPISAQFSGPVTLGGTGSLNVHTLQVDGQQTFTLAGGSLSFNRIRLRRDNTTAAKILITGNVSINPLNNVTAQIVNDSTGAFDPVVDLGGGMRTINVGNGTAAVDVAINAPITNGGFTKAGPGTLQIGGNNTFTGNVSVDLGTLRYGHASGLAASSVVTVNSGAVLEMNTFSDSIAALSGGGAVTQGTAALSLEANSGSNTFSGVITGTGTLTKNGAATQIFSGSNSLGSVAVNGGTLRFNATSTLGAANVSGGTLLFNSTTTTGPITVDNGGTLGGNGAVSGAVTVNSGGKISPGLTVDDFDVPSLTLNVGSAVNIDVTFFQFSDRVDVSGLLTLNGGTINVFDPNNVLTVGDYTIFNYGTLAGSLGNLGTPIGPEGYNYSLYDTGNSIHLVVEESPDGVAGDFNNDGIVDAADYVMWAKLRNTSTPLENDGDLGTPINEDHYELWQQYNGEVFQGSGGEGNGSVPEPSTFALWLLGICAAAAARSARPSR